MIRIERIDPLQQVEAVSCVLMAAWQPPSLHYTPEYLRWQLSFPGSFSPLGLAAYNDDEMIGFNGAITRRLRRRDFATEVYLVCFSAVHPAWRGSRAAGLLYKTMLEMPQKIRSRMIGFIESGSEAERRTVRAATGAGYATRWLGPFPGYGYVPRPEMPPVTAQAVETDAPLDLLPAIKACRREDMLCNDADEAALLHYHKDPRPHALTLLYGPDGDLRGGAIVVQAEFVTAQGLRPVVSIDNLFLPDPDAESLQALCQFAARRWAEEIGSVRITLPNVWGIDPDTLQAAGLRHRANHFIAQVCATDPSHPFLQASGTNLEIV
ncbi:MAG TPA: hypothetical protein VKT32_14060 [Chthonomonadaceae bacterium]|nr:hypothetical protein [Chthonomonadaceae bacterium]